MSLIEKLYGPFFDLENWRTVITSGEDWMIILSLVLIECDRARCTDAKASG